jgi:serine/threonine protein phosphatase PrpC
MTEKLAGSDISVSALCCGKATDTGKVRTRNEDTYVIDADVGLFGVADGMGGHPGGDLAAKSVAEGLPAMVNHEFETMRRGQPQSIRRRLKRMIVEQSRQLCLQGLGKAGYEGMGATLAVVLLLNDRAYAGNLGDSRIYRLRAGRLVRLSQDHSVVSELLEEGTIGPEDVWGHHAQGLLTQYVGMPGEAKPHVCSRALKRGDRFLLCTDGLTDMVHEDVIEEVLDANAEAQAAAEMLVRAANDAGGTDNTTVVIVDWVT